MAVKNRLNEENSKVQEATRQVEGAAIRTIDRATEGLKASMDKTAANLEATQARVKEGVEKAMKTAEQFVSFGQGNLEAFLKSSQILAAGVQDLSKQVAANAQHSLEETLSTFRALTGVKSLKEALELQTSYTRSAIEKSVSESSRLTESSLKLAEQAAAPLAARVSVAVETFTSRAA